jgi:short-subunit dehydrogenase
VGIAVLGDGAEGEAGRSRRAELAGHEHVERKVERARKRCGSEHAPPREAEDDGAGTASMVREPLGEGESGGRPIREQCVPWARGLGHGTGMRARHGKASANPVPASRRRNRARDGIGFSALPRPLDQPFPALRSGARNGSDGRMSRDPAGLALVTGGCSGIGRAIAERLAALGYELVLVSNQAAALERTAEALRAAHGVPVHPIVMDLARPEAAAELHATVRGRGHDVDVLVNNAGMFFFGEAADAAPERANTMLQLHVVTPSLLCTLFGRDMRARRRGHILIVSSISAWRDFPGISYYGSSKKYLRGFARALRSELGVYGVKVTCLAPGATATALYDPSVVPVDLARRLGIMMPAERVADAGVRAMLAGRAECTPGLLNRAMRALVVLVPQSVIDLVRRHAPWLPPAAREPT